MIGSSHLHTQTSQALASSVCVNQVSDYIDLTSTPQLAQLFNTSVRIVLTSQHETKTIFMNKSKVMKQMNNKNTKKTNK